VTKSNIQKRIDEIDDWKEGRNLMMEEIFRAKYGISVQAKLKIPSDSKAKNYYREYGPENHELCMFIF